MTAEFRIVPDQPQLPEGTIMLNHPLRLAVGSHSAGSGKGCAMNVISWESGDTTISDLPACADVLLAKIVQGVNDTICSHRTGDLLCPDCSVQVLALAHRTVGTGGGFDVERRRVWVRVAADQARQVLHLAGDRAVAEAAVVAAEAWADEPTAERTSMARKARATAAYAADAASSAADAAYAAYAAYASAASAYAADAAARLRLAHRAIDVFYQHTALTETPPDQQRTAAALAAMTSR